MTHPSIKSARGRARRNELADALITSSPSLSSAALLEAADGAKWYLPVYRSTAQGAAGRDASAIDLTNDGALTIILSANPPPELASSVGAASPYASGTGFALLLDASGGGTRIPLAAAREGTSWRLTATLAGAQLKQTRDALFDTNPNVAIEVTQQLRIAAAQSQDFVVQGWADPAIRAGLLDSFGGIPFDSPQTYFMMASGGDPDFPSQYMVLDCTYTSLVAAPALPGYVQWQVDWSGHAYNYYQDNQDRARIFYLPDRFELAKGPSGAAPVSLLQFSVPAGADSLDQVQATFRVFGSPAVSFERIDNAAQVLKGKLGVAPQMVPLQDAHSVVTRFMQYLPNAQATSSSPALQANAKIDLAAGLRNEVVLNFAQFRALWAAIFSTAPENPLFRGTVEVELLGGRYKDTVEFAGRLDKAREAGFFDDIIDTSTNSSYSKKFTFQTTAKALAGPPETVEVEISFTGKSVTLTPSQLQATITVERSVRDIVVGQQSADTYPCRMRVTDGEGSSRCCPFTVRSDTPSVWISKQQIAACTGTC